MSNTERSRKTMVNIAVRHVFLAIVACLVASVAAHSQVHEKGKWETAFSSGPLVHATVLPNGHVLHWSSFPQGTGIPGPFVRLWNCNLVNPNNHELKDDNGVCKPSTPSSNDPYYTGTNVYCSGHSLMPDGRVMITGGTLYDALDGARDTTIFNHLATGPNPQIAGFSYGPRMEKGRWYPTNVALGSGGTLVAAGTYCKRRINRIGCAEFANNPYAEILPSPTATSWDRLDNSKWDQIPLYPWLYYISDGTPSGKVFYAGPTTPSRWLDLQGEGGWSNGPNSGDYRESGSSVMYDTDKIMVSGGDRAIPTQTPLPTAKVIDLTSSTPTWQATGSMAEPRKHHNLTILANGTVLATGGTKGTGFNNNCMSKVVLAAEIWDPTAGTWSTKASMEHNRRYHSTAMLLIDGRVLVAGSDLYPSTPEECTPPLPQVTQTEIYTPPYLFNSSGVYATRPVISSAPATINYNVPFTVGTPDAASIAKVTLVRLSSVTHSLNMNQRFNNLTTFQQVGQSLQVTPPLNGTKCPPGHYMMFIINSSGVPSVAKIVKIE